ncbi:uracil-DNA glycosylase family protein [Agarivorans albus]|uniref:Uracil-DNA glycosylase-like domain-containing protein n=1 Tax=Agarivorans albus MKT 106 TaxID=1331007 RepID=R9PTX3_AGAAL|nr:uracil-DNA glycosylase family protein [Agarivorans albus]GAD03171.1 hypothetical protein VC0266 [Agarivorans albus MKT 106]
MREPMIKEDRSENLRQLLKQVSACRLCEKQLEPRPVVQASVQSKILIIGQAPGIKVHKSGVPWDDASGKRLRQWLGLEPETFYDAETVAIVPSAFCYPGKGKQGDLPPPKLCFDTWHQQIIEQLNKVELTLLIGQYAQALYLPTDTKTTLSENVGNYQHYAAQGIWPLPHPSPRNRHWFAKHLWFEQDLVPKLQNQIKQLLS